MVKGAVLWNFNEALKIESLELKPPRARRGRRPGRRERRLPLGPVGARR